MKSAIFSAVLSVAFAGNTFLEQEPLIDHVNNLKTTWTAGHNHYFDGRTME